MLTSTVMAGRMRTKGTRWTEPRCLGCGATADHALRELSDQCHECGCDFAARPPRSYAELEGLTALDIGVGIARRRPRRSWSWGGVLFLAAVVGLILVALVAEV